MLRDENECLQRQVEALLPPCDGGDTVSVPLTLLEQQEEAIARRMVKTMARRLGGELSATHVEAVLGLTAGRCLDLPGGLQAVCRRRRLTLQRKAVPPGAVELRLGEQQWGAYTLRLTENGREGLLLAADRITGPLTVALWDGTGRIAVENGSRTIKRLFADRGIPAEKRSEHPALYLNGQVIAVFGVAVDVRFRPETGEPILVVTLEKSK